MNNVDLSEGSPSFVLGPSLRPPTAYPVDEPIDIYWEIVYEDEKFDRYEVKVIGPDGRRVIFDDYEVGDTRPGENSPIRDRIQWNPSGHPEGIYNLYLDAYTVDSSSPEGAYRPFEIRKERGNLTIVKYHDLNRDRIYDKYETGLSGWRFEIQGDGPMSVEKTTDSGGNITLTNVGVGDYTIRELIEVPPNSGPWHSTTATVQQTVVRKDRDTRVYFGNILYCNLTINKYNDSNDNERLDSGDPPLPGVEFIIEGPDGTLTRTTDSNGRIQINDIPPGTYSIKETPRQGWIPLDEVTITLDPGQKEALNLLNTRRKWLEIVAFEDRNNNGRREPGESGLSGWRFNINGESKVTDKNGIIEYDTAGEYVVTETLQDPALWYNTTPITQTVTLGRGGARIEFGNDRYRDLTIHKFDDENENKVRDSTEIGLSDWEFYVEGPDGSVGPYQTNGYGDVSVKVRSNIAYNVSENTIVGWRNTTPSVQSVRIGSADNGAELNFGNTRIPLEIRIHAFEDVNKDGKLNPGEKGLSGWNFTIVDPSGNTLRRVSTDGDGKVTLTSKMPGSYIITEETRGGGWINTTPISIRKKALRAGGTYDFDFGYITPPIPHNRTNLTCYDCNSIYDPPESPWNVGDGNVEITKSINPGKISFDDFDENNGAVINYTIELRAKPKMAPADLVIAADTSTSISPLTLTDISNSIAGFAEGSRAYTDLRIGLVSWDDDVDEEGTVGITTDRDAVIEAAGELRARPYEITLYQVGLGGSLSEFSESPRDARKMIVFITDASGECKPFTDLSGLDAKDYAINVISVSPVQDNETKCMLENFTRDFNGELIIVDDPSKIEAELLRLSRENLAESQLNNVHLVDSLPGYLYPCDYTVNPPDEVRRNSDGQWETTTLEWDIGTISPNWSTSFEAIFCWRVPADVSQPEGVARVTSEVTYADPKAGDEKRVLIPEGGIRIGPAERPRTAEPAPSPSENDGIPGFGILASMTGLAAAAYLFKRD